MSAANYLVRWMPDIVEATADDIAQFGPNAARVRGLLNFLSTMSDDASRQSREAWLDSGQVRFQSWLDSGLEESNAWETARHAAYDAARVTARGDARLAAENAAYNVLRVPEGNAPLYIARSLAQDAARAEAVSDLITPEQYRILTDPLNIGRTYQERMGLMLPDQQGPFMQMVNQLRPATVEDVLAIERLSGNPNVGALLEMLTSPQMASGQPLARRIKAAETMYRVGRGGRGMA